MKKLSIFCIVIILLFPNQSFAQDFIILPNGHSHNDYTRERPLYDALKYGFTSIEVDVYWYGGRMVVTHDDKNLEEKPTIQELYLDPLQQIISDNGGQVYKDNPVQLVLMVDLKSDKVATYHALKEIFPSYLNMIEWYNADQIIAGPVKIVLTGGPPIDIIQNESNRYFSVDGTVDQWGHDYSVELMPRASTNYRNYFKWYGKGDMPENELKKMQELIAIAHSKKRKVRFWGCPNSATVWQKLLDEGVDWINVDDLKGYNKFYRKRISID